MASYTPIAINNPGSYTSHPHHGPITDDTYGGLGGTYGAIHYRYGGRQAAFGNLTQGVGSFTPKDLDSAQSFTPGTTPIGSFNPQS
jgi:hypothetical protein